MVRSCRKLQEAARSCSRFSTQRAGESEPSGLDAVERPLQVDMSSFSWPQDAFLLVAAVLLVVLCLYAFFYLNLSTEIDLDAD